MDPRAAFQGPSSVAPADVVADALALARRWASAAAAAPQDAAERRLDAILGDPDGPAFVVGMLDGVERPDDPRAAAAALERLSRRVPRSLAWGRRVLAVGAGGFAPLLPWPLVPIARGVFDGSVGHLVLDATPARLGPRLAALRERGFDVGLHLVGDAVFGDAAAVDRIDGTRALLAGGDVSSVSIAVSAVTGPRPVWAFDETVALAAERLVPLAELAAASPTAAVLTLDVGDARDLDFTAAVFRRLLEHPSLHRVELGIAIPASLPEALGLVRGLGDLAALRVADGGAGIRVRLLTGPSSPVESLDAARHGWPPATVAVPVQRDANAVRCVDWILHPDRAGVVGLDLQVRSLADAALAVRLAELRGVERGLRLEWPLGVATAQRDAVAADVRGVRVVAPVVDADRRPAAVGVLIPRLRALADDIAAAAGVAETPAGAQARLSAAVDLAAQSDGVPARRQQDRSAGIEVPAAGFAPAADTDPTTAGNRRWASGLFDRIPGSRRGADVLAAALVDSADAASALVAAAVEAGEAWGARPAADRARVLGDAGDVLEAFRGRLIETAASEAGATVEDADAEVSEVVDAARWTARLATAIDEVAEARFRPARVTVVASAPAEPVASAGGATLAALAAGSAVLLVPAPSAGRCAAVLCEALWEAGVPREALRVADVGGIDGGAQAAALVHDPRVDRVLLAGVDDDAVAERLRRAGRPLPSPAGGVNTVVVTGSADLDLVVADLVRSLIHRAGQADAAVPVAILVGSVATSERLRVRLADAVRSLDVGAPDDPATAVGPLIAAPTGALLRALTELDAGESWLVAPRRLGDDRRWAPGVRDGVGPESWLLGAAVRGPVLSLVAAPDLDAAIAIQRRAGGALAGLHSFDPDEIRRWVGATPAPGLVVNREWARVAVASASLGRRSIGGLSLGGPNALVPLGDWEPVEREPEPTIVIDGVGRAAASVLKRSQAFLDFPGFDFVRRAAVDDERSWSAGFGVADERSVLELERTVRRSRPATVTVRLADGAPPEHLIRLLCAAAVSGATVEISSSVPLPTALVEALSGPVPPLRVVDRRVESDAAFLGRLAAGPAPERIRIAGGEAAQHLGAAVVDALGGASRTTIWSAPVTASGRVELLPFLLEQTVTITAHRFGVPVPGLQRLPL